MTVDIYMLNRIGTVGGKHIKRIILDKKINPQNTQSREE